VFTKESLKFSFKYARFVSEFSQSEETQSTD